MPDRSDDAATKAPVHLGDLDAADVRGGGTAGMTLQQASGRLDLGGGTKLLFKKDSGGEPGSR